MISIINWTRQHHYSLKSPAVDRGQNVDQTGESLQSHKRLTDKQIKVQKGWGLKAHNFMLDMDIFSSTHTTCAIWPVIKVGNLDNKLISVIGRWQITHGWTYLKDWRLWNCASARKEGRKCSSKDTSRLNPLYEVNVGSSGCVLNSLGDFCLCSLTVKIYQGLEKQRGTLTQLREKLPKGDTGATNMDTVQELTFVIK